jgi:hypothetical protein
MVGEHGSNLVLLLRRRRLGHTCGANSLVSCGEHGIRPQRLARSAVQLVDGESP